MINFSNSGNIPLDFLTQIKRCASVLQAGGIAAYPTDTVYGLGTDVYNDSAVKRIFAAKQRPVTLPLPILIGDLSQLNELAADIPSFARKLMTEFWPGALTIVFNKAPALNSPALAGNSRIGVRLPGHAVTLRLIQEAECPIVGTSANLHNHPAPLTAAEVREQIGTVVDFILDGGPCPGGVESTIVDVTADPPVILRTGAIPEEGILNLLY